MFTQEPISVAVEGGIIGGYICRPKDSEAASRTPLIVTHGGPGGTCFTLHAVLSPLAAERPVVFYDQLGSHLSPAPVTSDLMKPERFGRDMAAVADHAGFGAVHALGHSWGGAVVLEFALAYPARAAGVILSSPLIATHAWLADANRLLAGLPQDVQDTIRQHEAAGTTGDPAYEAAAHVFMERHFCRMKPWPDLTRQSFGRSNRTLYNAMWGPSEFTCTGTLKDYDRMQDLHRIACPALLTCGRHDEATPETMAQAAALMPDARVHVFEESAHIPYLEETDAYLAQLRGFMNR